MKPCNIQQGWKQVKIAGNAVLFLAGDGFSGPANQKGYPDTPFITLTFGPPEPSFAALKPGAVITGKDNDGVFFQSAVF